jgi:hypothetical protein
MHPLDTHSRALLAAEHVADLRADAVHAPDAAGVRRRLGGLLVDAGFRLAPELRPTRRLRRVGLPGPAAR